MSPLMLVALLNLTQSTVLSNVAVLVGLVFLIIELRQSSAIALSQMTQERTMEYIDQHASYAADKDFSELCALVYFQFDYDSVTQEEWNQIIRFEESERTRLRDNWFQGERGLIDQSIYDPSLRGAGRRLEPWKWLGIATGTVLLGGRHEMDCRFLL